jgi:hypothetical protein
MNDYDYFNKVLANTISTKVLAIKSKKISPGPFYSEKERKAHDKKILIN